MKQRSPSIQLKPLEILYKTLVSDTVRHIQVVFLLFFFLKHFEVKNSAINVLLLVFIMLVILLERGVGGVTDT